MEKNIKNIKQQFKEQGVFYTPPELALTLKEYVPFKPKKVYDPTCGCGNLLKVFDDDVLKFGQELDETQVEIAKQEIPNFMGYAGDTLQDDKFKDEKFDCIVGNPPFSIKWEQNPDDIRFKQCNTLAPKGKADYAFLLHIIHHLSDDGVAVVLNFPGIAYRGNAEGKIRQWFIENNYIERVVNIPGDTFVDTKISTLLLVLRKNKTTTNVIFEDREDGRTVEVSQEDIAKEKYNLSVSTYLPKIIVKEPININEVNKGIVEDLLKQVEATLKFNRKMEKIFTEDNFYTNYMIDELKRMIKEYEE